MQERKKRSKDMRGRACRPYCSSLAICQRMGGSLLRICLGAYSRASQKGAPRQGNPCKAACCPFIAISCKALSLLRDIRRAFRLIMHKTPSPHGEYVVVTMEAVQQPFAAHATNCQGLFWKRCQYVALSCCAGFGRRVGPFDNVLWPYKAPTRQASGQAAQRGSSQASALSGMQHNYLWHNDCEDLD